MGQRQAKNRSKADYNFSTEEEYGIKFLLIEDMNMGNVSVTNDVENVVADIEAGGTDITDHVILYQDSSGDWDGWSKTKGFFPVGGGNGRQAMERYARQFAEPMSSRSRYNVGNIPSEVMWVWAIQATKQPVGIDTYKKITGIIEAHPKHFPWEHLYSSIPQELHEAYQREAYPEQFIKRPDTLPHNDSGILSFIPKPQPVSEISIEKIRQMFEDFEEMDRLRHEQRVKRSKIWRKHYGKYGLKERI